MSYTTNNIFVCFYTLLVFACYLQICTEGSRIWCGEGGKTHPSLAAAGSLEQEAWVPPVRGSSRRWSRGSRQAVRAWCDRGQNSRRNLWQAAVRSSSSSPQQPQRSGWLRSQGGRGRRQEWRRILRETVPPGSAPASEVQVGGNAETGLFHTPATVVLY